jgi:hypothetical protein
MTYLLSQTSAPLGALLLELYDVCVQGGVVRRRRCGRCSLHGREGVSADNLVELGGEGGRLRLFRGKRRVSAAVALEEEGDRLLLRFLQ